MTMMTMRRFLLKREVAAISDWGLEKERTKEKKSVWLCTVLGTYLGRLTVVRGFVVEAPCWMDV